jgi:predicted nuclease of predicted toxin-antitoxin system
VRFKIDENLPDEAAQVFEREGYDVHTVHTEDLTGCPDDDIVAVCLREERILVTLDLDFADIRSYPPARHPGFIVLRLRQQLRPYVLDACRALLRSLETESPVRRLWVVDEHHIRVRE